MHHWEWRERRRPARFPIGHEEAKLELQSLANYQVGLLLYSYDAENTLSSLDVAKQAESQVEDMYNRQYGRERRYFAGSWNVHRLMRGRWVGDKYETDPAYEE